MTFCTADEFYDGILVACISCREICQPQLPPKMCIINCPRELFHAYLMPTLCFAQCLRLETRAYCNWLNITRHSALTVNGVHRDILQSVQNIVMLAASGGKRNGVRPSAYLSGRHTHHDSPLHQGATCDAASVHFSLTIKRIDLGFKLLYSPVHYYKGEQSSYPIFLYISLK